MADLELTPTEQVPTDLKARLKASYDAIAPTYNTWTESHGPLRLRYLNRVLSLLQPRHDASGAPSTRRISALELGCGAGVPVTETLLSLPDTINVHVTANDLSSAQIGLGKARLGDDPHRITWVEGDMMDLSFPPDSLDLVVALYSVIHLPREEQAVLLERVAGWLRPGGLVLVNFGREEMGGAVMERWLGEEKGWMYWSGFGEAKTLEVVRERAGLEVLVSEVTSDDGGTDAEFLWVIARKKGEGESLPGV
jgi:SAM-dependent methyltransferase